MNKKRKQTKLEKEIQKSPVWQAILVSEKEHGIVENQEFSMDDFEEEKDGIK